MHIRTATLDDLDAIAKVEATCFPASEAATKAEFEKRLQHYADYFWLMFDGDQLIAFVDGMVSSQADLTDEMFENATLHDLQGAWQMILKVNILLNYRKYGSEAKLIYRVIDDARQQGRKGVVLTCKEALLT